MDKQLSALTDAAEYLSDESISDELAQIKEALDSKLCYISFVGHFSAEKSKLINNLLGMDILPCGRMEVTPVMTYIRGGKNNAYIHYFSGKQECVSLGELKNICQHTDERCDEIEYIDISLENKLLSDGMVLIDTPGLNTTILKHEKLFNNTLMKSTKIVYVIGKSPSLIDVEKLKMICENKCDFIIVRTHCDEIKSAEETFEQVTENDSKVFKEADFNNPCYYVSNESDSNYFLNIDHLRNYLRACLVSLHYQ